MTSGIIDVANNPSGWDDNSIVRHISDPFSDEALAEPLKTYIDVGSVNLGTESSKFHHRHDFGCELKSPGKEVVMPEGEPEELIEAHELFIDSAKIIMGRRAYTDSLIILTHDVRDVEAGNPHRISTPHLDGYAFHPYNKTIRIAGVAVNEIPPILLQGPVIRDDILYGEGYLKAGVNVEQRFEEETLPANRLILLSPATLHVGQIATSRIADRAFLRYQLYY